MGSQRVQKPQRYLVGHRTFECATIRVRLFSRSSSDLFVPAGRFYFYNRALNKALWAAEPAELGLEFHDDCVILPQIAKGKSLVKSNSSNSVLKEAADRAQPRRSL